MARNVRERMVAGATRLLASKGLQATSFSEVIELTDTPRGSIYHHFPGGKDELVLASLQQSCQLMLARMDELHGADPRQLLATFFQAWRDYLVELDYTTGCAVVAVTVATDNPELVEAAAKVFAQWEKSLGEQFAAAGMPGAHDFASALLSAVEGAVVVCRAKHSLDTLDATERQFERLLDSQLAACAA